MTIETMINDAAKEIRTVYLTFVLVTIYYAISVASTSDRDLVLNTVIELPLLNTGIPIIGFYIVAPLLFLILHLNLFVQTWLLSKTIKRTEESVKPDNLDLGPFPASCLITGNYDSIRSYALLLIIVLSSYVLIPVFVLALTQVSFLAFQDEWITAWHRFLIFIDLIIAWVFWRKTFRPASDGTIGVRTARTMHTSAWIGSAVLVYFVSFDAIVVPESTSSYPRLSYALGQHALNLEGEYLLLSNDTKRPDLNDPLVRQKLRGINFEGRSLRQANFSDAVLINARFGNADLREAKFSNADLRGARWRDESRTEASLAKTSFTLAKLDGADLSDFDLKGSLMVSASLRGADLRGTDLAGANLMLSDLKGAQLFGARLEGAVLFGSDLRLSNLSFANLNAADLRATRIDRTLLIGASFHFSDLRLLQDVPIDESDISELKDSLPPDLREQITFLAEFVDEETSANFFDIAPWSAAFAIFDELYPRTRTWGQPPPEKDYDRLLSSYLYELGKEDRRIADTMVSRVDLGDALFENAARVRYKTSALLEPPDLAGRRAVLISSFPVHLVRTLYGKGSEGRKLYAWLARNIAILGNDCPNLRGSSNQIEAKIPEQASPYENALGGAESECTRRSNVWLGQEDLVPQGQSSVAGLNLSQLKDNAGKFDLDEQQPLHSGKPSDKSWFARSLVNTAKHCIAMRWTAEAAEAEDSEALYQMGMSLVSGSSNESCPVEIDRDKGTEYLHRAANLGHRSAKFEWAKLSIEKKLNAAEMPEAKFWSSVTNEIDLIEGLAISGIPEAQWYLGIIKWNQEKYADALPYIHGAAKSGLISAQTMLGTAYTKGLGVPPDYRKALSWFERAIGSSKVGATARSSAINQMAWLFATCPDPGLRDGAKALQLAKAAVQSEPGNASYWDTLAAAYAELGLFDKAVSTQQRANALIKHDSDKSSYLDALNRYENGQPTRDSVVRELQPTD